LSSNQKATFFLQKCHLIWLKPFSSIPNQWTVFFARSDWLLKLVIVSAILLMAFFWISRASFPSFLRKEELFKWCWLSTVLVYYQLHCFGILSTSLFWYITKFTVLVYYQLHCFGILPTSLFWYSTASRLGKYPPLFTSTGVNNYVVSTSQQETHNILKANKFI